MTEFSYAGSELQLFKEAGNWKRYWTSEIQPWIRGVVLEVGAGIGANTPWFAGCPYDSWLCLEPDRAMAIELQKGARELRDVAVRVGTVADLTPAESFDTILYADVLEHIGDDAAELRRASAHLRTGGHLIVLSPANESLFTRFDEALGHFRRYSPSTLKAAAPAELSLISMRHLDSVGMFASFANRFLAQSVPTRDQIGIWDRGMVPLSRVIDPVLGHRLGRSVIAVWQNRAA